MQTRPHLSLLFHLISLAIRVTDTAAYHDRLA
jgi:hypothetical protein